MADRDVQQVKQTGTLWTVSAALGIVANMLLIITLIAVLAVLIMAIPMINEAKSMMGSAASITQGGGPQAYGGYNYTGQQQGGNQTSNQSGNGQFKQNANALALKVKSEVDSGNWDSAIADWATLKPMLSSMGMPSEMQGDLSLIEQTLNNRDKEAFDARFSQMEQKYGAIQ